MPTLTLPDFVARWRHTQLGERQAAHSHFIDLCEALEQPRPSAVDQVGESYTFEKHVWKAGGGKGFADVWYRGHFAWEYKGPHKDLRAAYGQLVQYHDQLENPPLLVVCDLETFEVHTKFTSQPSRVFRFSLSDLGDNRPTAECPIRPVEVLRALFNDPRRLRSDLTPEQVTKQAALKFASLADRLTARKVPADLTAHFIMRLLFCMFAEAIGLLPDHVFSHLLEQTQSRPKEFSLRLKSLFAAMSAKGGSFGPHDIPYFNGGLFSDDSVIDLTVAELGIVRAATSLDWGSIEPAIFGTLFEASLDRSKRSRLGAHYTSLDDILTVVEPVLMNPLREEWTEVKAKAWKLAEQRRHSSGRVLKKTTRDLDNLLKGFASKIGYVRILDPACGSGNFLYVALRQLLDLEREISFFAAQNGLSGLLPLTDPSKLFGIENDRYAHELASIVVWIGFIQWQYESGLQVHKHPVLKPLDNIRLADAVMDASGHEPTWPEVDVIIGNPPFLGDKKMRAELGDDYVDKLRALYDTRVPGGADLVTYWFEKSRAQLKDKRAKRVGLLATNSISMMGNRPVLERIKESGDIFMAWSDRAWVLDGADVRVAMIGFDDGAEKTRTLDGKPVANINSDLTSSVDVSTALPLSENDGMCFLGMMKAGPFDISEELAGAFLRAPRNINGCPNSNVVKRRFIARDITGRGVGGWIIDFGLLDESEARLYELPFEYALKNVKPVRDMNRRKSTRQRWWRYGEARPGLRSALVGKSRCIVTPEVAKHRLFCWMDTSCIPDHTLHVIAREDDYMFGVLHSNIHEVWSLSQGSWMGVGNDPRYSSSRTFETFPFPWIPGNEPEADNPRAESIASAARNLVTRRNAWLNPPGTTASQVRTRTLTNLYNQRPSWLESAHKELDQTVSEAYGWADHPSNEEILRRLLTLNHERSLGRKPAVNVQPLKKKARPAV